MKNLSTGKSNSEDLKGPESLGVLKEVTEVDILWKAYETYLENILLLPGELPDWLRVETATKESDISQSLISKLSKGQLVF